MLVLMLPFSCFMESVTVHRLVCCVLGKRGFREMLKSCLPCFCDPTTVQQEKGYCSLQDEAIKIFNSLQEIETVSDPIPIIQGILQTCHDLKPLRDEVYCQLIKQTNHIPQPNSSGNLHHWQLMSCMSCTFLPSRGILRYLKFHLRR